MGFESYDVERKISAILGILSEQQEPLGARVIANRLNGSGVKLGERAVRYHLKLMDERGLTRLIGRDGRQITEQGLDELQSALVRDKVGLAISKIEVLAFQTDFNFERRCGPIPSNLSFFSKEEFTKALRTMRPAFQAGLCTSRKVMVANEGERLGEFIVPRGKIGFATVCSIVINGALLKAGIPMDSRFGGILQIRNNKAFRFVELIHYAGSSLDPSEIFIRAGMTSVGSVAKNGNGRVLANFREIPSICKDITEEIVAKLQEAGIGGLMVIGNTSEPICEVPVDPNRNGMILLGGMNPVAAACEVGIEADYYAMSTIMDYKDFVDFDNLV